MKTAEPRYSKPDKDIRKEEKYRSTSPTDAKQYDHLIDTKSIWYNLSGIYGGKNHFENQE